MGEGIASKEHRQLGGVRGGWYRTPGPVLTTHRTESSRQGYLERAMVSCVLQCREAASPQPRRKLGE